MKAWQLKALAAAVLIDAYLASALSHRTAGPEGSERAAANSSAPPGNKDAERAPFITDDVPVISGGAVPAKGGHAHANQDNTAAAVPRRKLFTMYGDALGIPDSAEKHPFWLFEYGRVVQTSSLVCCLALMVAGVLCAAGGIGGGGVYVTVLMVAGSLEIGDAVPLSKATVFIGSFASLLLNMGKTSSASCGDAPLIDANICRAIVPCSLGGTYLGVLLNRVLPSWVIALLLTLLLITINVILVSKTWSQYLEETAEAKRGADGARSAASAAEAPQAGGPEGGAAPPALPPPPRHSTRPRAPSVKLGQSLRHLVLWQDFAVVGGLMLTVIFFGVFRYHAGSCQHSTLATRDDLCHPFVFRWLGKETLLRWMTTGTTADAMGVGAFFLPLCGLVVVVFYYNKLLRREGWSARSLLEYNTMSLLTGCLAGLMGIGGGLIFSPFLLLMKVEPAVAVATSSTCVMFTAASTSLQYLFTDRIIVSLAIMYGLVNTVASYAGTKLVHFLQDKYSARKSFISAIVMLGVVISTVLAVMKLVETLNEQFGAGSVQQVPTSLH